MDALRLKGHKGLHCPLWTENKALLIQQYIKLFTYVTKHGAYIDGFAAPQYRNHMSKCSAKLVLENKPQWIRNFWFCDLDLNGIALLEEIKAKHYAKGRSIRVVPGDFNISVERILNTGRIKENVATFALLDQRTFQCEWATVEKLARHKKGRKIELFYFFPSGWIDRAIKASTTEAGQRRAERWWGRSNWRNLKGMDGTARAYLVADRLREELGYKWAQPYPIYDSARGGRTMYHMIHATDHDDAPTLMLRAYRKVAGDRDWQRSFEQTDIEELLQRTAA